MNKFGKDLVFSFFPFIVYSIIKPYDSVLATYVSLGFFIGLVLYYLYEGNLTNMNKFGLAVSAFTIIYRYVLDNDFYMFLIIKYMCIAMLIFMLRLIWKKTHLFKWLIDEYYSEEEVSKYNVLHVFFSYIWAIYFLLRVGHEIGFFASNPDIYFFIEKLVGYDARVTLLKLTALMFLPLCFKKAKRLIKT